MTSRGLAELAKVALNLGILAYLVWQNIQGFRYFSAANPGASYATYLADSWLSTLAGLLIFTGVCVILYWWNRGSLSDADTTEFHERGSH